MIAFLLVLSPPCWAGGLSLETEPIPAEAVPAEAIPAEPIDASAAPPGDLPAFASDRLEAEDFSRLAPANPYEAVLSLKSGSRFGFRDGSGREVAAAFQGWSPADGIVRYSEGGTAKAVPVGEFFAGIADGSLRFLPGPLDLDVPARQYEGFGRIVERLQKKGIKVEWEKGSNSIANLASVDKKRGFDSGAYFFAGGRDANGKRVPKIILAENASLGALLKEVRVAKAWNRTLLQSEEFTGRLNEIFYGRAVGVASKAASDLALDYILALRDLQAEWDKLYNAVRMGRNDITKREKPKYGNRIRLLSKKLRGLGSDDAGRPVLGEAQRKLEEWYAGLDPARLGPGFVLRASRPAASAKIPYEVRTAIQWKGYSDEFQRKTTRNLENLKHLYLEAKREGDPHIRFLEWLGFRFEPEISVPPLEQIFRRYNEAIRGWIAGRRIEPQFTLTPARVFKTPYSKVFPVRFGDPIPPGAYPADRLLTEEEFARIIEMGYFPMGENINNVVGDAHSALEHDLGHLSGFLSDPAYMAGLRRAYSRADRGALALRDENGSFTPARERLYHLTEYLSVVPPENRERLLEILPLPAGRRADEFLAVDKLEAHLKTLPKERLLRLIEDLKTEYPGLIRHLGGGVRDIVLRRELGSRPGRTGFDETLDYLFQRVVSPNDGSKPLGGGDRSIYDLARLIVWLEGSTRVEPGRLFDEASEEKVDTSSSLYRWLCGSGALGGGELFNDLCRDALPSGR